MRLVTLASICRRDCRELCLFVAQAWAASRHRVALCARLFGEDSFRTFQEPKVAVKEAPKVTVKVALKVSVKVAMKVAVKVLVKVAGKYKMMCVPYGVP